MQNTEVGSIYQRAIQLSYLNVIEKGDRERIKKKLKISLTKIFLQNSIGFKVLILDIIYNICIYILLRLHKHISTSMNALDERF